MNPSRLDVRVVDTNLASVVAVRGDVDMASAAALQRALADELRDVASSGRTTIVIDLSAVPFLDSSGLAVLIAAHQNTAAGVRLVVSTPAVERLLMISGMDQTLEIHPTLDAALAADS